MLAYRFLLFFLLYAIGQEGFAQNNDLAEATRSFCASQNQNCNNELKSLSEPLRVQTLACQALTKSSVCQEYLATDPYLQVHARTCNSSSICEENLSDNFSFNSCVSGYFEGAGESLTKLGESITSWATDVKLSVHNKTVYISLCNEDVECKRDLIKYVPRFKDVSDRQLEKYTAAALVIEKQNYDYISSVQRRNESSGLTISQRAEISELKRKQRPVEVMSSGDEKNIFNAASKWFEQKNAQLSCLDPETRAEVMCWGVAYVIDPLLVVGASAKAIKAASYVRNLAQLRRTEKAIESLRAAATLEEIKVMGSEADLQKLFQELKKSDIPFCSIRDGCDARAHKVAMVLEERGVDSQKIFAVPSEGGQLKVALNRTGTLTNEEVGPWRYHVATLVRIKDANGNIVERVIDPSLFSMPVERSVWEARMRSGGTKVEIKVADKKLFRPGYKKVPVTWDPKDISDTEQILKNSKSFHESYMGRQIQLKARWVDMLKVRDPEAFKSFQQAIKNSTFRNWWENSKSPMLYKMSVDGSLSSSFVDREAIREIYETVPVERLDAEVKTRSWEQVWEDIQLGIRR